MRRALKIGYALAWLAFLLALTGEVALAARRRIARQAAEQHAGRNVFEAGREVAEGRLESLWEVPGIRYKPGARLDLDVGGERYAIQINSHGYRGSEWSEKKPLGVVRIVCIGGSTTVQGRTNELTYPSLLEKRLEALAGPHRVEVLNLGINGTRTGFWLSRADELFRFEPDLVIEYAFVNDFFWHHVLRYGADHPARFWLNRSLLLARLTAPDPAAFDPYFRDTLRNLRAMSRVARTRGAGYLAASFAGPDALTASPSFRAYLDENVESWGHSLGLRAYVDYDAPRRRYNTLLAEFAGQKAIRAAPIAERIRDASLFVDLCHMTQPGIELLADAFLPEVREALGDALRPSAAIPGDGAR